MKNQNCISSANIVNIRGVIYVKKKSGFLIILLLCLNISGFTVDGAIEIQQPAYNIFPVKINNPGSYVLTSNLAVPAGKYGIEILTNNVTIDLNGHIISGSGQTGFHRSGIHANNRQNIKIYNGIIKNFKGNGIFVYGDNNQLKEINSSDNGGHGFNIKGTVIKMCSATKNTDGFYAQECTIIDCQGMNNKTTGFEVFDTIMENCLSINNGLFGIDAERSSILQCSVLDNANHYGMYANESIIINCNIAGNKNGMYILNKNQIRYNNIRNSQWYGMFVTGVNNYITHNSASGNISIDYYIINNNNTNYIPMLTDGDNANLSW